jgi:AcrR family transcriptional regulator
MDKPSKHTRTSYDVRQRILVAAEELFADKGFAATSIREIASSAGVNSAMIYYYFKDKRGLYRAIVDFSAAETYRMLLKAFKGSRDPADQLREFCTEYARAHYMRRDVVKIIHREMLSNGEDQEGFAGKYFKDSMNAVRDILTRGIEDGTFRDIDVGLTGVSLFGLILFVFLSEPALRSVKNIETLDEASVVGITGELIEIFLSGIVNKA